MTSPHNADRADERNLSLIPEIGLTEIDGEPRARDTEVAERLGLKRPRVIRELIERNRTELEGFGPLAVRHGESRGQEFDEFWLTEEQSLLAAALSKAPNAPAVRAMLIRCFVAWRRGHLAPVGSESMTSDLYKVVTTLLPALVAAECGNLTNAWVRDSLTAGQVLDLEKVPSKGRKGLVLRTASALRKYCERNDIVPREATLGNSARAYVYPLDLVHRWLRDEGRKMIREWRGRVEEQGTLRLVSKA